MSGVPDVTVSKFPFLNEGSLWEITFDADAGDVKLLGCNFKGLHGTSILSSIAEDVRGSVLGGTFRLYSSDAFAFPSSTSMSGIDVVGKGRSAPLAWNATASDIRAAIEKLLPHASAQGMFRQQLNVFGGLHSHNVNIGPVPSRSNPHGNYTMRKCPIYCPVLRRKSGLPTLPTEVTSFQSFRHSG